MTLSAPVELIAGADSTDLDTYVTASGSPAENTLLTLFVVGGHLTAAASADAVAGMGIFWTRIADIVSTSNVLGGAIFTALSTGTAGALTIEFPTVQSNAAWILVGQVDGVVEQFTEKTAGTSPTTITLTDTPSAGSRSFGFMANNGAAQVLTPTSPAVAVGAGTQPSGASPPTRLSAIYADGQQTLGWTSNNSTKVVFAVELSEDSPPPENPVRGRWNGSEIVPGSFIGRGPTLIPGSIIGVT